MVGDIEDVGDEISNMDLFLLYNLSLKEKIC